MRNRELDNSARPSISNYEPTTKVVFGENTIGELGRIASEIVEGRVLIVTDPGIVQAGHLDRAVRSLRQSSREFFVFQGVEENPTTKHVEEGLYFAKENGPIDLIVGLGGGSAMDCAKGINFLLTNGGKMDDYWGEGMATKPMLPSIGIPTTAGTGSEAQSFALITQERTHQKMACGDKKARFRAVILDPLLLTSVPRKVAATAGIDAIAHAVESYVSKKRTPFSQMFSREAMHLLANNYNTVLAEPDNVDAWGKMLLGAHFAGAAIENSMLGAAHACANPLTAHYGIAHGVAVALMLPDVIKFNGAVVNGDYGALLASAGMRFESQGSGAICLAERIAQFKEVAGLPQRLRDCQVEESQLPQLAKEAATQWTGRFNPRQVDESKFLELYKKAF